MYSVVDLGGRMQGICPVINSNFLYRLVALDIGPQAPSMSPSFSFLQGRFSYVYRVVLTLKIGVEQPEM